ncbi:MAG: hypothetical protein Q8M09_11690 [Pseudomonadota bacterium]|nr:hypothetical protein [Pseudomonadota bacterium]MDP1904891.1 hypothetical protein [Pseudomonadota bacterium]MDP2353420.1 hypothetical protein [Pseudomonadota bacterium]
MKKVIVMSGLILMGVIFTGCVTTGQHGSKTRSGDRASDQSIQSDRGATTDTERGRTKRDATAQKEATSTEPAKPRDRKTPAESVSADSCTGGQFWVENRCECHNNFYWNERLNQCRPVANCSPGKRFDRELDRCVAN